MHSNLVSTNWLIDHLSDDNLVILDATIPKAGDKKTVFETECIPSTLFFDLKKVFTDQSSEFPNTVPLKDVFEKETQNLGINSNSVIVIYDQHGVYSSPRAWWLFKLMGHQKVYVLNGGLPAWLNSKLKTQLIYSSPDINGDFKVNYQPELFKSFLEVLARVNKVGFQIIDARSEGRFLALKEEPRKGLRSGHIPGSVNLHYSSLTNQFFFKTNTELTSIFEDLKLNTQHIIYTCGSGITACILAFAGYEIGLTNFSVYDGSWSEWGMLTELPIEK